MSTTHNVWVISLVSLFTVLLLGLSVVSLVGCTSSCTSIRKGVYCAACAGKSSAVSKSAAEEKEGHINTAGLKSLLDSETKFVLLDARSGKYDDGRRIPGAKSLSPEAETQEAAKLISAKDTLVVTYCTNLKCPASQKLAKQLRSFGYKNILEYSYGIEAWVEAGNSLEKA